MGVGYCRHRRPRAPGRQAERLSERIARPNRVHLDSVLDGYHPQELDPVQRQHLCRAHRTDATGEDCRLPSERRVQGQSCGRECPEDRGGYCQGHRVKRCAARVFFVSFPLLYADYNHIILAFYDIICIQSGMVGCDYNANHMMGTSVSVTSSRKQVT
ncbi:hypothetical protein BC938DRAFT_474775, partial [Jimgerdemannia flammicorona]